MAVPDITALTLEELQQLITAATQALYAKQEAEKTEQEQRRARIAAAIAANTALLGPEGSAPYDPATGANETINGVLAHDTEDHAVLAQHAGLALSLILRAMKVDVSTGLDIARVIASGED